MAKLLSSPLAMRNSLNYERVARACVLSRARESRFRPHGGSFAARNDSHAFQSLSHKACLSFDP